MAGGKAAKKCERARRPYLQLKPVLASRQGLRNIDDLVTLDFKNEVKGFFVPKGGHKSIFNNGVGNEKTNLLSGAVIF